MTMPIPRPDFVVVGTTYRDGVVLLASKELNEVELKEEVERVEMFGLRGPYNEVETITLTADLKDYLWVTAPTYPEAWTALFRQWSPPVPHRVEISSRRREIE